MAERRGWTRPELILAMNRYCKMPFGQLHARQPQVVDLARALGHTPGSVSMKPCNFASFDPALAARGVRGLRDCPTGQTHPTTRGCKRIVPAL